MKLLVIRGVSKTYPGGVKALDSVDFDLNSGEVHALLGENGAGKSTLSQIIFGLVFPDSGEIIVKGERVRLLSPRDALRRGIIYVPQYPDFPYGITVWDVVEMYARARGVTARRGDLESVAEELGWSFDWSKDAGSLTLVERQRLMITLAIALSFDIVILDEPTAFLSGVEVERLLPVVRRIARYGAGVIYVTHRIPEVRVVADRVTVLRRGRVVARIDNIDGVSDDELVRYVVGVEARFERVKREGKPSEPILEVTSLHVADNEGRLKVRGVNLEVRRGEVVAIVGIEGMGQRELLEAIAGLRKPVKGVVLLNGVRVTSPRVFRKLGGRFVPGERLEALALEMTVLENIVAPVNNLQLVSRAGFILHGRAAALAERIVKTLSIATPGLEQRVSSLSGGNQQKVVLGREMLSPRTRLLVMHNPSAGLDVASTINLHRLIASIADKGVSVLFSTPVLDEAFSVADRLLVMRNGVIVAEFDAREASKVEVAKAILA